MSRHLLPLPSIPTAGDFNGVGKAQAAGFSDLITNGLSSVNKQLLSSQQDLQKVALGETQNLHHIMVKLEESRLTFQLMMQLRNRLLESYQDVMKMQI